MFRTLTLDTVDERRADLDVALPDRSHPRQRSLAPTTGTRTGTRTHPGESTGRYRSWSARSVTERTMRSGAVK